MNTNMVDDTCTTLPADKVQGVRSNKDGMLQTRGQRARLILDFCYE